MQEQKLLAAAMDSREAFSRIAPYMDEGKDFSPPGQAVWKLIKEWYEKDSSSTSVDRIVLADLGHSRTSGKQRDVIAGFLDDIGSSGAVSARNIAGAALELKRYNVGMELAAAIASGDSRKQGQLASEFKALLEATELRGKKQAVKDSIALPAREIGKAVGKEARVPLAPSRLNSRVSGGALPGTHILFFARPEMGKSTFSINFAVRMGLKGQRVLYITNEDNENKLKQRAMARLAGISAAEVETNVGAAADVWEEKGFEESVVFRRMEHAKPGDLRGPIAEHEPTVLIVDQIRNLEGNDSEVQRLDENGQLIRELLNEYGLIGLSVTQAGDSAEGREWLGMGDLYGSKTGLPACADLMIGMGASEGMKARGQRALSILKNKLSSESNAKEGLIVELDVARVSVR